MCAKHYQRARYQSRESPNSQGRTARGDSKKRALTCKVAGCESAYYAKGFCGKHYQIDRRRPGETHNLVAPKGSGWATKDGYRKLRHGGRVRFQHHVVMEQHMGRPLHPDETVHHRNGVRDDNRIENLELRVKAHGKGILPHDAVAWAREILERYD